MLWNSLNWLFQQGALYRMSVLMCDSYHSMSFFSLTFFLIDPVYPVLNLAGCYVNGQILAHGDHWREDDCTFCQCVSGDARCVAAACGHSCLNPVTVPGECCPVCEGKNKCTFWMWVGVVLYCSWTWNTLCKYMNRNVSSYVSLWNVSQSWMHHIYHNSQCKLFNS